MYARFPLAVLLFALAGPISSSAYAMRSPSAHSAGGATAHLLLSIINRDREQAGVGPLRWTRKLCHVALVHSLDMADHHYFAHDTPIGTSPFRRLAESGIRFAIAGENLGFGSGYGSYLDMLEVVEQSMLQSPQHRSNLLRVAFRHVGIGIAVSAGALYVTEDFTG
ncbi:MAG: CAP domain-containing protein [Chloroflexota bacterium]|nr:CAP domain-containing protein [Chloroflexota bacterium]